MFVCAGGERIVRSLCFKIERQTAREKDEEEGKKWFTEETQSKEEEMRVQSESR